MALPKSGKSQEFIRAALQRFEDARTLLNADRTTGAVYLAGYSVECAFKALLLSRLGATKRAEMMESFRGARGHSLDSLRDRYERITGVRLPMVIAKEFSHVISWNTDMRYETGTIRSLEAITFVRAVEIILTWIEKRV